MSEELLQIDPIQIGRYQYFKIGASTLGQLRDARIIRGRFDRDLLAKKPDGLIVLRDGTVRAVIEYKPPTRLKTAKQIQTAIDQELLVARSLGKILIVTSGSKSIWINTQSGDRVQDETGVELSFVVDVKGLARGEGNAVELERLLDSAQASLSPTNNKLTAPTVHDPSVLANTIWQKIWVQTGKSPEKCLYNVVELFVFKFLSDLGVLAEHNDYWNVERIATRAGPSEALKYYANNCRKEIRELFPAGKDGTSIINGTIFVNEEGAANVAQAELFAEIIGDLANHDRNHGSFRYINREFKTRLYESFLRQSAGIRALGQYFTPRNVVQAMVKMARDVNSGARICDPFCGVGGFVLEMLMEKQELYTQFSIKNGRIDPKISLIGYDKGTDEQEDERTIILAKANMLIYFSDLLAEHHSRSDLRVFCDKVLNNVFRLLRSNLGTFERVDDEPYDLIVTNPPYVTKVSKSLQDAIAKSPEIGQFYDFGLKGTEGLALNWIVKKLRNGGEALVIVPDTLLRRQSALRELRENCLVRAIVSLPTRTFYATKRQTYILALERKHTTHEQADPVFGYIVQSIGETLDKDRVETTENDLTEMVSLFRQFRAAPDSFNTQSPRCKMIPFSVVADSRDWRVERWWPQMERVNLGLEQKRETINQTEFIARIDVLIHELQTMVDFCRDRDDDGFQTQYQPVRMRKAYLSDLSLFDYVTTYTGWTKRDLHKLKVDKLDGLPVYSAAAAAITWVVPTHPDRIEASPEFPLVSFAANGDGSAGTNFIVHESPFFVTADRTILRILNKRIDPRYLVYALRNMKSDYAFDHTNKAVPTNLRDVGVDIPLDENDEWDIGSQRDIAKRYDAVRALQASLQQHNIATQSLDIHIA
ncbi:MAG: N-6 DNA methylase [Gammaproteobacteria bacterium]|nr:N-6 DNA methylase [Gammaproteobacteria bacterium]